MKRFKVVQDASGDWGILDMMALTFRHLMPNLHPFAAYGIQKGEATKYMSTIIHDAVKLNAGIYNRRQFSWEDYEERG